MYRIVLIAPVCKYGIQYLEDMDYYALTDNYNADVFESRNIAQYHFNMYIKRSRFKENVRIERY